MTPLRVAIIGMGGFAAGHQQAIRRLEAAGACTLVCSCDPRLAAFAAQMRALDYDGRGVRVFDEYRAMLDACAGELDVVTVPTPVPLHAEMHRACVDRQLAVYLEKPPTLDWRELEEMLAVEARAVRLTHVGFNYIDDPVRQHLKARMREGEFGAIRTIGLTAAWPRPTTYFQRAAWAGRLELDGRLVLDSCMGNALAHYVHNALFWAGECELLSWARAESVQAELYRAHAIQGFDTVFASALLREGPTLRLALTHACAGSPAQSEWVACDRATVQYVLGREYRITWRDGRMETGTMDDPVDWLPITLPAYFAYVRGERDRPTTRLVDARPFVELCDLVYPAAGRITPVPEEALERVPGVEGAGEFVAIRGIRPVIDRFVGDGVFPSALGLPWAVPGGSAGRAALPALPGVIRRMAAAVEGCASARDDR